MTTRIRVSLFAAMLLGSAIPYSANAAEQHSICVKDWVGCQSDYQISCATLSAPGATIDHVRDYATAICRGKGYISEASVVQVGTSTPGGQCGTYKYNFTCQ
jgi:hypothetical protein